MEQEALRNMLRSILPWSRDWTNAQILMKLGIFELPL